MHSSLARVLETLALDDVKDEQTNDPRVAENSRRNLIGLLTGVPHYVIDDKLLLLVINDHETGKLKRSMKAMVDAGIRALPFDPILIEFDSVPRSFVRLQSKPFWPQPPLYTTFEKTGEPPVLMKPDLYAYPVLTKPDIRPSNYGGLIIAAVDKVGVPIEWVNDPDVSEPFQVTSIGGSRDSMTLDTDIAIAAVLGMSLAMLMLNTKGIAIEHVSMAKLNKARAKSGGRRPPVNDYHVVKVGTIYDRHGNAHSVAGSGRHMPVHWRAGHVRNQRYGPFSEPAKHKQIWIEPCLVNYEDGPVPVPKKEVKL